MAGMDKARAQDFASTPGGITMNDIEALSSDLEDMDVSNELFSLIRLQAATALRQQQERIRELEARKTKNWVPITVSEAHELLDQYEDVLGCITHGGLHRYVALLVKADGALRFRYGAKKVPEEARLMVYRYPAPPEESS